MVIRDAKPDEVYNLAAQSFVPRPGLSRSSPASSPRLGVTRLLEAIRLASPRGAVLPGQLVGDVRQGERNPAARATPFYPARPTASPKSTGTGYGELPGVVRDVRGERHPVQPRVARAAASSSSPARSPMPWRASSSGLASGAGLGQPRARRDWGFAGTTLKRCGGCCSKDPRTTSSAPVKRGGAAARGAGLLHVGLDWRRHVVSDPSTYRPAEVNLCSPIEKRAEGSWDRPEGDLPGAAYLSDDGGRRSRAAWRAEARNQVKVLVTKPSGFIHGPPPGPACSMTAMRWEPPSDATRLRSRRNGKAPRSPRCPSSSPTEPRSSQRCGKVLRRGPPGRRRLQPRGVIPVRPGVVNAAGTARLAEALARRKDEPARRRRAPAGVESGEVSGGDRRCRGWSPIRRGPNRRMRRARWGARWRRSRSGAARGFVSSSRGRCRGCGTGRRRNSCCPR